MRVAKGLAIGVAAAILGGLALAGCGGDGPADPSLVLYNGEHPQLTSRLVQAFTQQSHINVRVRTADGIVLADQILQEGTTSSTRPAPGLRRTRPCRRSAASPPAILSPAALGTDRKRFS